MKFAPKYRFSVILALYLLLNILLGIWLCSNSHPVSTVSAYCSFSFLTISFFTFILSRIHLYYHSKAAISLIHLGIISVFSWLGTLILTNISKSFDKFDSPFVNFIDSSFYFTLIAFFVLLLLAANQFWIDKHVKEQENTSKHLVQRERDLVYAELSNIQEQFRPHFIFNSLNSISALIVFDTEKAREMIHLLSDFLRASVQPQEKQFHTLKEEFEYLNLYLSIEKVRFEDRLKLITPDLKEFGEIQIPVFILQPILENAIKFGVYGTLEEVCIEIEISQVQNKIILNVTNPYNDDTSTSSKGKGFGINSIKKKMHLLYHRNDLVNISKSDNKFTFQLVIPLK